MACRALKGVNYMLKTFILKYSERMFLISFDIQESRWGDRESESSWRRGGETESEWRRAPVER